LKSSKIVVVPFEPTPLYVTKAALFRTLGHPARVRILELLGDGELSVGALQEALDLDSGGTSQHLAALRRIGLVESRKEGTSVYYRASDPQVLVLLEVGRGIIARTLTEQQSLLEELEAE
jgi:DNA-binding transcriptional ArsR family regulator